MDDVTPLFTTASQAGAAAFIIVLMLKFWQKRDDSFGGIIARLEQENARLSADLEEERTARKADKKECEDLIADMRRHILRLEKQAGQNGSAGDVTP